MEYAAPVLFALGTWWLSTVLMMWRSQRARPGCRGTMAFMTALALAGLILAYWVRNWTGVAGAYLGFIAGIAIWAWHEMSYFLGLVTGPRPLACPPGASSARRFALGIQASLWHELAIIATAGLLAWLTWGAPNATALLTFVVLWLMRWSAKLNIFLGVRNLHQEFWPEHLRYLGSYVHTARMNALFPVSMFLAALALVWLVSQALAAPSMSLQQAGGLLVGTLLALAILEHVLMFLDVPDAMLWRLATGTSMSDESPATLSVKLNAGRGA